MAILVLDPYWEEWIKSERGEHDRDEVWDGVLVILAPVTNEHQEIAGELFCVLSDDH